MACLERSQWGYLYFLSAPLRPCGDVLEGAEDQDRNTQPFTQKPYHQRQPGCFPTSSKLSLR